MYTQISSPRQKKPKTGEPVRKEKKKKKNNENEKEK